ncbi:MAG: MarR family transcriptional regulator, partial [Flavobacteriales bacterium]|nr:MarR family transcriptional regulator [Flavobacteriales bacterium]
REGTPATKLGPKMGMEPTGLTRLLKSMEAEGLIERVQGVDDRRVMLVRLTQKGKNMREKAKNKVVKFNEHLRSQIPAAQLNQFFNVITKINRIMEEDDIFGKGSSSSRSTPS